jgi:subtilisin family serine protease
MKKYISIPSLVAIVLASIVAAPGRALAQQGGGKKFVPGQVIVVPQPTTTIEQINAFYGSTTVAQTSTGAYLIQLPSTTNTNTAVRQMRTSSQIQAASPNLYIASPASRRGRHPTQSFPHDLAGELTSDRTGYDSQPFIKNLNFDEMNTTATGANVVVAVIDTGIDPTHPDLEGRLVPGYDFVADDADPSEERDAAAPSDVDANAAYGHGTFIAGLIAKVAPNARIMPIRALRPDGTGEAFDIAEAVDFAVSNDAHILNMSFGAPTKIDGLVKELAEAKKETILVAATGNSGADAKLYPAEESSVIAVGAVDDINVKPSWSNFGSLVDLSAPGVEMKSTYPGGQYATWSGTSFAAPVVAATAALLASRQIATGEFNPDCAAETLVETGRAIDALSGNRPFRGKMGALVDPLAAVTAPGCGNAYRKTNLIAANAGDRKAEGEAEYRLDNGREEFRVKAEKLRGGAYTLRVTRLDGSIVLDDFDGDEARYRSDDGNFPAALSPVTAIEKVEILRGSSLVLTGTFSTIDRGSGTGGGGGGDDDDDDGDGDDDGDDDGGGGDDGGNPGPGGGDGGGDGGGGGDREEARIDLDRNSEIDPDAQGYARWRIEGSDQELKVEGSFLDPNANYEVWINGMLVGILRTNSSGDGEIEFNSSPEDDELPIPPSLNPVSSAQDVEIRNASGVVLYGSF